ncbi:MAG: RDD family protein [Lachnospiraceae bacterium]|nr:RDD family protein [Lachnospiraceae bacterium]
MQSQLENNVYAGAVPTGSAKDSGQTDVVYAGFFVRLIAFAIDSLIAAIIVGIIGLPSAFRAGFGSGSSLWTSNFIFDYSLQDVLKYLGVAAYFVLLTYYSHSTLGKMLFRLEVVTRDGEWTFLNILYRETVGRFLSSILNIGYIAILVTQGKQGFHDMLCDTNVVYAKMAPAKDTKKGAVPQAEVSPAAQTFGQERTVPQQMERAPMETEDRVVTSQPISAFEMPESHPISAERESENHTDE